MDHLGGKRGGFAFLYQSDAGTIDARTWSHAGAKLFAVFVVLTAGFLVIRPYAGRGLADRTLFDPLSLVANLAVLIYGVVVILLGVSWMNLSAKRFRDRGDRPPLGLAAVLPFAILFDGTLRWLQPQVADTLPRPVVFLGDAVVVAALAWTVAACTDVLHRRP